MTSILEILRRFFFGTSRKEKLKTIRSQIKSKKPRKRPKLKRIRKKAKKLVKIKVRRISRRIGKKKTSRIQKRKSIIKITQSFKSRPKLQQQSQPQLKPQPQAVVKPSPKVSLPSISFLSPSKPRVDISKITKPVIAKPAKIPPVHKLPREISHEVIVSDMMVKNVFKVKSDDTLSYVVRLFAEKGISGAPVMHDDTFVGNISETDILKVIGVKDLLSIGSLGLKRLGEIKVDQVMNKNPVTISQYARLSDAVDLMNKHDVTRLPVLDERRNVVGILTRSDIIRGISKEILFRLLERKPEEIEKLRGRIETDIDEILRIVERRGLIGIDEIQKKLNIPQDKIEEWGKVLEKHELVELFYPPIGKPELRKKTEVVAEREA